MKNRQWNFSSISKNLFFWGILVLLINCSANHIFAQDSFTADGVRTIIAQAVSTAVGLNRRVTVAVTDPEGNVLGIFLMNGANRNSRISGCGSVRLVQPSNL